MGVSETWQALEAFFADGPSVYMWAIPFVIMVSVLVVLCMLKREFGDEIIPLHEGKPLNYKPTIIDLENYRRKRKGLPPLTEEEEEEIRKKYPQKQMPKFLKDLADKMEDALEEKIYGHKLPSSQKYKSYE